MTYARPRHAPDATETRESNETASSAVCSRALLVFTPDGARIVGYDDESMSGLILGGIKGLPKPARRGTCPGGLHSWIHPTASTICPCPSSLSPATLRNFHPAEKVPTVEAVILCLRPRPVHRTFIRTRSGGLPIGRPLPPRLSSAMSTSST